MIIGIIIIIIGLVFLLQSLGLITGSVWQIIWPILIIIAGLGIICKEKGKCCCGENCEKEKK
jgi:hypothetical protein